MTFRTASEMLLVKRPLARPSTDNDSYLCLSWRRTASEMLVVERSIARFYGETVPYLCLSWRRAASEMLLVKRPLVRPTTDNEDLCSFGREADHGEVNSEHPPIPVLELKEEGL